MHLSEELLRRYFQNQCTLEEEQFVREALEQEDPVASHLLEKYWREAASGQNLPLVERHTMLSHIQSRIASGSQKRPRQIQIPLQYIVRIAASVTVLLAVGIGLYALLPREPAIAYHVISSGTHQEQVIMPDSTIIWLANHTRLTYSSAYNKNDRQVQLAGEAYFEVAHNTQRPFIVNTSTLATRVLGTHFNVKADSTAQQIEVTLLEGKVSVSRVDSSAQTREILATLAPNQQLVYDRQTGKAYQRTVTAYDYAAWKDGVLNLKSITFNEALMRIEKWYKVRISVSDPSIGPCMIHASFEQEPLENVLKSLSIPLGFSYTIQSHQVAIQGGGCSH